MDEITGQVLNNGFDNDLDDCFCHGFHTWRKGQYQHLVGRERFMKLREARTKPSFWMISSARQFFPNVDWKDSGYALGLGANLHN